MKLIYFLITVVLTQNILADYPIVSYRHLADPGALVYNGRVYLYCSNDDDNEANDEYNMHSIVCVSSNDLKNWTDHGVVFEVPNDASWANKSWAPSPVERDGKFFLYFGNGGSSIGVASSDSPTGPFKDPIGKNLVNSSTPGVLPADNIWLFDPMTFIDYDGQAYMYFGGNGENNLRVIKLNNDMISVDGSATQFHVPFFFEAAWMHEHNDTYYFSYSTNPSNGLRIDYMTSDNPLTGFSYGGVISNQPPDNNNNNHHAIFKLNGEWYQAYHNRIVARQEGIEPGYKRNLCLDQFHHNEDGSIQTMVNTVDGVEQIGYVNPFQRVEAETINAQNGIETDVNNIGGMNVTNLENGDWIKISDVDFGSVGAGAFTANLASEMKIGASTSGSIEIRLDSKNGTLIGKVPVSYTGGLDKWKSETITVEEVTGVHDIYFIFTGENVENLFNFDHWEFIKKKSEHELLAINAFIDNYKIDTLSGYNTTNFSVTAIYTDGISEVITSDATFSFDDETIISITDSIITGLIYGDVTVIFSYEGFTDSVNVIVKNRESELSVSRLYTDDSNVVLYASATLEIEVFAEFSDKHIEDVTEKATYDNPNPEIATILNGIIKAISKGEVDITASYKGEFGETKSTIISVTVNDGFGIWLEPECAEVGEDWEILSSDDASNGTYVRVKSGTQSLDQAPTGDDKRILIPFTLDASGSFKLSARLNCPTYDDDSFWISVDNGNFELYNGLVTNNWEWFELTELNLTKGEHIIIIGYREDGALLDKIALTNYPFPVDGMGEEAENICDLTIVEKKSEIPEYYKLEQNYPNPFNPSTIIGYQLPTTSKISIKIYNIVGEEVTTLFEGIEQAGYHKVTFDASNFASGIYFYQLKTDDFMDMKKIILMK